jgi:predicted permease
MSLGAARDRTSGPGGFVQSLLVTGQVALSLVLVVAAVLFLRTLSNLRHVDLGFSPERQLIADVNPRAGGYEGERFSGFSRRLLDRLREEPGIIAATFSENGVLLGRDSTTDRLGPAGTAIPITGLPKSHFDVVGPRYLATMKIPIVEGRDFDERDTAGAPAVMAINETMARQFFGSAEALGRRMRWDASEFTVVAVVGDVRVQGPHAPAPLQFYISYFQHPDRATLASMRVLVRTAGDAAAMAASLRSAIQSVDPAVPAAHIEVTAALVDRALARQRMIAALATTFGALALGLASVGLYGLIAYGVARRTSEIGLRLALGATRQQVIWIVAKRNLALVGAGAAVGLPLAIAGSSLVEGQLFGVEGSDPAMLGLAIVVLAVAAVAAASVPTLRATKIQPVIALRHD